MMASRNNPLAMLAKRAPLYTSPCRHISTSFPVFARRLKSEEKLTADQAFDLLDDDFDDDDSASAGHIMLRQQRQVLHYLRLIEHEMPKLVGMCLAYNLSGHPT